MKQKTRRNSITQKAISKLLTKSHRVEEAVAVEAKIAHRRVNVMKGESIMTPKEKVTAHRHAEAIEVVIVGIERIVEVMMVSSAVAIEVEGEEVVIKPEAVELQEENLIQHLGSINTNTVRDLSLRILTLSRIQIFQCSPPKKRKRKNPLSKSSMKK